jgi:hypothetical protein
VETDHGRGTQVSARGVQVLLALLLLALAFLSVTVTLKAVYLFSNPSELYYPNSIQVYNAREFAAGRPIYSDFNTPPHVIAIYGPLTYAIPGLLAGDDGDDPQTLFRIGRGLALVAALGTLLLICLWLHFRERTGLGIVLLVAMLIWTAHLMWPVSICYRPDTLEMFFEILGMMLFLRWRHSLSRYLSIGAFLIAFSFKHSAMVGPTAVVVTLLLDGERRQAMIYAAASLVSCAVLVLFFNTATDGMYLLNCFSGLGGNVTPSNLVSELGLKVLSKGGVLFALFVVAALRSWFDREVDPFTIFFLAAVAFACATTFRDGSNAYYFIKALAAGCIISGKALAPWLSPPEDPPAGTGSRERTWLGVVVLVFLLGSTLPRVSEDALTLGRLLEDVDRRGERNELRLRFLQRVARKLDGLDGPILFRFGSMGLYSKNLMMMDTLLFSGLADQGVFDDSSVVAALRSRRIAAVVSDQRLQPKRVPRYQSTDLVRKSWVEAMVKAGYVELRAGSLYIYRRP